LCDLIYFHFASYINVLKEYENSSLIFTKIEHITVLSYEISWNIYANIRKVNIKNNDNVINFKSVYICNTHQFFEINKHSKQYFFNHYLHFAIQ